MALKPDFDLLRLENNVFLVPSVLYVHSNVFDSLDSFTETEWIDSELWGKINNLCHFWGISDPFDPPPGTEIRLSKDQEHSTHVYANLV